MRKTMSFVLVLVLSLAFISTGFTSGEFDLEPAENYGALTEQVWAVSVTANAGETGSQSIGGQAAYGSPENALDDDYVGNYFNIGQETYVSSGETNRHIDVSSPYSHGYLTEDVTVTGMARIKDSFSMENLPAGSKVSVSWWELF